jgi:lysophospholipase L1-like esterase
MLSGSKFSAVFSKLERSAAALHKGNLRIVAFGSSTTEGVGASAPENTYPARLELELKTALPAVAITVINHGQGGEEAEDFQRRLPDTIAVHPEIVIFQTGTNDAIRSVPLARFEELTRAALGIFNAAGIDVVLMDLQYSRAVIEAPDYMDFIELLHVLGAEYRLPVIHRFDLMQQWLKDGLMTATEMVTEDDLHMGDKGYAELARAAAKTILESI